MENQKRGIQLNIDALQRSSLLKEETTVEHTETAGLTIPDPYKLFKDVVKPQVNYLLTTNKCMVKEKGYYEYLIKRHAIEYRDYDAGKTKPNIYLWNFKNNSITYNNKRITKDLLKTFATHLITVSDEINNKKNKVLEIKK